MRLVSLILICICLICCGESTQTVTSDTVSRNAPVDSSVYVSTRTMVQEVQLPFLMAVDSIEYFDLISLDDSTAYELLPGEFEYESYKEVYCFGRSKAREISLLWFLLVSDGYTEEWPDDKSIVAVMYDRDSRPYDVYNTSFSGVGFSYSYVTVDSAFSVMIDEMENINVTTTEVAITEKGFIAGDSKTETFNHGEQGYVASRDFALRYIGQHSSSSQVSISK